MAVLMPRRVTAVAKHNHVARRTMSSPTILTDSCSARSATRVTLSFLLDSVNGWMSHCRGSWLGGLVVDLDGRRCCSGLKDLSPRP